MLDLQLLRGTELEQTAKALEKRGFALDVATLEKLETQRKLLQVKLQECQAQRNSLSKAIGMAKGKGENTDALMQEAATITEGQADLEKETAKILEEIRFIHERIPNVLHDTVPVGHSDEDNIEVRRVGTIPTFNFEVKDHVSLGEQLKRMDFEVAGKIAGARFVVLKGELVQLQRALTQFMIDIHRDEHGYEEIYTPYMANRQSLFGTGQLPKFEEDLFHLSGESDYFLIPTAEVTVTNLVRDDIVEKLPLKYVAHTPCFRSEAGSYGKDTRGMIRQHQFEKVEMVEIVEPSTSYERLEVLVRQAGKILERLELPYRVMLLCSKDTGFCSAKTYDLEVWIPSQNKYREISSCSNFEAFQARRLNARYRTANGKTDFVHTLNGSGLAVGRTLVALLENCQDAEGNIHIPKALQPYMQGKTVIQRK
jgi:seryl-tRNA synthetase